jgi:predicted ABC-type sugar transport system permease subunit
MLGDAYVFFGKGDFFGIPMPIIIMLIVFLLSTVLLNFTRFGGTRKPSAAMKTPRRYPGLTQAL